MKPIIFPLVVLSCLNSLAFAAPSNASGDVLVLPPEVKSQPSRGSKATRTGVDRDNGANFFAKRATWPVDVYGEVLIVTPHQLFDSTVTNSKGFRFGARYNITDYPYKLGLQVGYVTLGSVDYKFPSYSGATGNPMAAVAGMPTDRRSYGFPVEAHHVIDTPKGIEVGASFRVPLNDILVWGMNANYIFDLSNPQITGVSIPDTKKVRGNGFAVGVDISYRRSSGVEFTLGYEHMSFGNHLYSASLGPLVNIPREFGGYRLGVGYSF